MIVGVMSGTSCIFHGKPFTLERMTDRQNVVLVDIFSKDQ